MKKLFILLFVLFSFSMFGQKNITINWDTVYIELVYGVEYVVWEMEDELSDTTYIKTVITDTSEVMPIIRADRNAYYYRYLADSIRMYQNKIKYDAMREKIYEIEKKP